MAEGMAPQAAAEGEAGGGITEVLQGLDKNLFQVTEALKQGGAPDEAKAAFQTALDSFRQGLEILMGGGEGSQQAEAPVSPEQGGSGAVPASMRGPAR